MNIGLNNRIFTTRPQTIYRETQSKNGNTGQAAISLYEKQNIKQSKYESKIADDKMSVIEIYYAMSQGNLKIDFKSNESVLALQGNSEIECVENEAFKVSESDEMDGFWCIYNKQLGKEITFDPSHTSLQTDDKTGKKYLIWSDRNGSIVNAMSVNDDLMVILKKAMNVEDIETTELNNHYIVEKNSFTGIETLKKRGAEEAGAYILIENVNDKENLERLANEYMKSYPTLVTNIDVAKGLAMAEVCGYAKRTENGILMVSQSGMEYMDDKNPEKGWGILYSADANEIYLNIIKAISEGILNNKEVEDFSNWEKFFGDRKSKYNKLNE